MKYVEPFGSFLITRKVADWFIKDGRIPINNPHRNRDLTWVQDSWSSSSEEQETTEDSILKLSVDEFLSELTLALEKPRLSKGVMISHESGQNTADSLWMTANQDDYKGCETMDDVLGALKVSNMIQKLLEKTDWIKLNLSQYHLKSERFTSVDVRVFARFDVDTEKFLPVFASLRRLYAEPGYPAVQTVKPESDDDDQGMNSAGDVELTPKSVEALKVDLERRVSNLSWKFQGHIILDLWYKELELSCEPVLMKWQSWTGSKGTHLWEGYRYNLDETFQLRSASSDTLSRLYGHKAPMAKVVEDWQAAKLLKQLS